MNTFLKIAQYFLISSLSLAIFFGGVSIALANTPTYSVGTINGNQIQINVNGDANSTVNLYYYQNNAGSALSAGNIGTTNSNGYFSTIVSSNTYNIPSGSTTYVTVNGQQSPQMSWPYYTGGSNYVGGSLSLSQTSVTLAPGQGTSISIYGGNNDYTISSNSNPPVVSSLISYNRLNIYGTATGNATLTVCSPNSTANCVNVFVTVSGNYNGGNGNYNNGSNCFNGSYYYTCNTNNNYNGGFNSNYNNGYYNGNSYNNGSGFTPLNGNGSYSNYNYNNGFNSYNGTPVTYTTYTQPTYQQPVYTPVVSRPSYSTPVSGVYLSQVPSTGITWNLKTILFTLGLLLWSGLVAHLVIERKKINASFR